MRNASVLTLIIITIGASGSSKGRSDVHMGQSPLPMPMFIHSEPVLIFGARLAPQALVVIGPRAGSYGSWFVFQRTMWQGDAGKRIQPTGKLMGINVRALFCSLLH
jgi:branched-chain amino acid transport system permease protein